MAFPYYAVIRKEGEDRSASLTFEANNVTDALNEMARKVGVTSTHNLDSYELYEIVENGDGYKPVAEKWSKEKRERMIARAGKVIKTDELNTGVPAEVKTTLPAVIPAKPVVMSEPEYESYEVEAI